MRVIYKYPLYVGPCKIRVPVGSKILKIMVQDNEPYVWIEHDTALAPVIDATFNVFGTGMSLPDNLEGLEYIDSFMLFDGGFVGHVYGKIEW